MGILHSSGYVWWIERGKLAIGTTSDYGNTVSAPSTASHVIRVYGKEIATVDNGSGAELTKFTTGASINLDEYSKLPEQFHDALIAKVMEYLYRKDVEGLPLADYWSKVYMTHLIEAKKYANSRRLDTGFNISQNDM